MYIFFTILFFIISIFASASANEFYFSISSPPVPIIDTNNNGSHTWSDIFDSNLSSVVDFTTITITGDKTLGFAKKLPSDINYYYQETTYPHITRIVNHSGFNESTDQANGQRRTSCNAYFTSILSTPNSQGDHICYNGQVFVMGRKGIRPSEGGIPTATWWGANAAGGILAGAVNAGADGVHLNALELNSADNGYDAAANMFVGNLFRNNDAGNIGTAWHGMRLSSFGTKPIDSFWLANGPVDYGLDFRNAKINDAAIALASGQKITFSSNGNFFVQYDAGEIKFAGNTLFTNRMRIVGALYIPSFATGNVLKRVDIKTGKAEWGEITLGDIAGMDVVMKENNIANNYIPVMINGKKYKLLLAE